MSARGLVAAAATVPNGLYDAVGVDVFGKIDPDQDTQPVEWLPAPAGTPVPDPDVWPREEWPLEEADAVLHAAGYRRITEWEFVGDYHQADVEKQ